MDNATGSLPCLSPISFPLETNPTSVGLRVHSFTQSQALTPMCLLASNNKCGMPAKMTVPHVGDYWVNQKTVTPFSWSEMYPTRLSNVTNISQSISVNTHWKTLSFLCWKNSIWQHTIILIHTCRSSFLPDKPWYLVTAKPGGGVFWFQLREAGLWTKPLLISLMDLTIHVQSAFFFFYYSQDIFYQPRSAVNMR